MSRVQIIKQIYSLDWTHFTISGILCGINYWMLNDTIKQREEFNKYKQEWYNKQLKTI